MKSIQKTFVFILFALLIGSSTIGFSQQSIDTKFTDNTVFPKDKFGEVLQNLISTFNSKDTNKITAFVKTHFEKQMIEMCPMEIHQEFFLSVAKSTGGIVFHSLRNYNDTVTNEKILIFQDQNYSLWRELYISITNEKECLISSLFLADALPPLSGLENKITQTELVMESKNLIEKLYKKDLFSGTVLIANNDKILFEKACGEASKSYHVLNNIDTKFNLGSMNKMFTVTAIMQLVEKGVLKLNDTISKYINEDWLPKEITNKITIHHLLSHSSGLGSYFNETYFNSSRELYRIIEDFKPLVQGDTLLFEPGTRFEYSNTGMLLLGVIIQNSTKQDYFEYIRKNIYEPSGMTNSDSYEMDQPVENLAIGYIPTEKNKYGWENNLYKHVIKGGPAGGGYSTVRDLHKFALALTNEKLISKTSLDLIWTDHLKSRYGYGFEVMMSENGKVVGHSGGFPGLNSNLDIFLENGYVVVVMSNYDSAANPVATKIKEIIGRLKTN